MRNIVCCFGHRNIFNPIESAGEMINLRNSLCETLEMQIKNFDAKVFMTGGRGEFDNLFGSAVRYLKNYYPHIRLILVEPYFSNRLNIYKEYYNKIYDSIIIPDVLADVYYKEAIVLRNKWMIDNCDTIISYINRYSGGAYKAVKYADSLKNPLSTLEI